MGEVGLMMKYFVLKPEGDTAYHRASRKAMRAYAEAIEKENPKMAEELVEWASKENEAVFNKAVTEMQRGSDNV